MPCLFVRRGLWRVNKHEATGKQCCHHYFIHNILRFVPVQHQSRLEHMNRE
jgi:hypothetical protein